MKRLFIAVDILEELRDALAGSIEQFRTGYRSKGVSWIKPENFHITIKFLGDTDETTEAMLIESLERIASNFQPFKLHTGKPEILGKRILSIAVGSDSKTIFSIEMTIDTELERLGFKREGRRFHPHLTVARVRDPEARREAARQFLNIQIEPISFSVSEIALYESILESGGSVYRKLNSFKLNSPN